MIRNDLHVHSVQSMCGLHTVLEIVEIAAGKGMRLVNISDHGDAIGKKMNFWVLADKKRFPGKIRSLMGVEIKVLAGIEANILDIEGGSDLPEKLIPWFDLVSTGFHHPIGESARENTTALENYLARYPLDILVHPCKDTFPLDLERVVALSLEYGFAMEVNNTNLRVEKTDLRKLERLIRLAGKSGAALVENSDGHTFFEIGENDEVEAFLHRLGVDGDEVFLNRDVDRLEEFLVERKRMRQ